MKIRIYMIDVKEKKAEAYIIFNEKEQKELLSFFKNSKTIEIDIKDCLTG